MSSKTYTLKFTSRLEKPGDDNVYSDEFVVNPEELKEFFTYVFNFKLNSFMTKNETLRRISNLPIQMNPSIQMNPLPFQIVTIPKTFTPVIPNTINIEPKNSSDNPIKTPKLLSAALANLPTKTNVGKSPEEMNKLINASKKPEEVNLAMKALEESEFGKTFSAESTKGLRDNAKRKLDELNVSVKAPKKQA